MALPFAKLQGTGNDFVVVDGRQCGDEIDWAALARQMCDRHFGVGADGLLVAARPESSMASRAAHRMRMFNPDGSESEMCGNGLRCFARWLHERGELGAGATAVDTGAGVLTVEVGPDGSFAAGMGRPRLAPRDIPLSAPAAAGQPAEGPVLDLPIRLAGDGGRRLAATCVSMGNPHAVIFVPAVDGVALEALGPQVEGHELFPRRTNVEFCQVVDRGRLRVRVWERGAGATLACGTGACAAMVAARLHGRVDERVVLELPGGELEVEWPGSRAAPDAEVVLRGPAAHVFDGAWRRPVPRRPPAPVA